MMLVETKQRILPETEDPNGDNTALYFLSVIITLMLVFLIFHEAIFQFVVSAVSG